MRLYKHTRLFPQPICQLPCARFALAWGVMVGGLVGFWCLRPWLEHRAFNVGQFVVLGATWKIASLLCLPTRAWGRFTSLRFLAYCVFIGMQPRQFLIGQRTTANAPIPTLADIIGNAFIGAALLWLVPRVLPAGTPWTFRFWIAIAGFCFLFLFARFEFPCAHFPRDGIRGREAVGLPDRRDDARRLLGTPLESIVPGCLRMLFSSPVSRKASDKVAILAVFLYSGFYHELFSFMANSGYGRPALYFLLQCLGVMIENTRRMHRLLRGRLWLARAWTFAVICLPVGLFLHPGLVHEYVVPMLVAGGVPGLER